MIKNLEYLKTEAQLIEKQKRKKIRNKLKDFWDGFDSSEYDISVRSTSLLIEFLRLIEDLHAVSPSLELSPTQLSGVLATVSSNGTQLLAGGTELADLVIDRFGEKLQGALAPEIEELARDGSIQIELEFHPVKTIVPITDVRRVGQVSFDIQIRISHEGALLIEERQKITTNSFGDENIISDRNFEAWQEAVSEAITRTSNSAIPALPSGVLSRLLEEQSRSKQALKLLESGKSALEAAKMLHCQGLASKK